MRVYVHVRCAHLQARSPARLHKRHVHAQTCVRSHARAQDTQVVQLPRRSLRWHRSLAAGLAAACRPSNSAGCFGEVSGIFGAIWVLCSPCLVKTPGWAVKVMMSVPSSSFTGVSWVPGTGKTHPNVTLKPLCITVVT